MKTLVQLGLSTQDPCLSAFASFPIFGCLLLFSFFPNTTCTLKLDWNNITYSVKILPTIPSLLVILIILTTCSIHFTYVVETLRILEENWILQNITLTSHRLKYFMFMFIHPPIKYWRADSLPIFAHPTLSHLYPSLMISVFFLNLKQKLPPWNLHHLVLVLPSGVSEEKENLQMGLCTATFSLKMAIVWLLKALLFSFKHPSLSHLSDDIFPKHSPVPIWIDVNL